jgi:tetratricopeptide (TPR) repeat protein
MSPRSGGLDLDVWHEGPSFLAEELRLFRAELQATPEEDRQTQALLCYEIGRLQLAAQNEPGAAEALLRAYTLRPQFRPTLRLARHLYRERSDFKLLIKLLDAEARATRDPLARAALLRQQARVLWSRLGDLDGARQALETAHRLDASDLATIKLLELFHANGRDDDALCLALERAIASIADATTRSALLVTLALTRGAGRIANALSALAQADEISPGQLATLSYLEQLYESQGMYRELASALERQAEKVLPVARAKLLGRAARVMQNLVGDADAARELYWRSLESTPVFSTAADAFDLLIAQGRQREALEVGARLFELDDGATFRASLACQLGDLCRGELDDPKAAADWYGRCLRWSSSYQPALEGLGRVLEQSGEIDRLLQIHRADLASVREPQAVAIRLYRIASLLERHDREPEALEIHREALAARPGFKPSLSALERLYTRLERWTELLQLYDEELAQNPDRERTIHILETMASLWYHQLGHTDQALACYRRVLELDPQSAIVLGAAARLCAEARRWQDLVELTEQEIQITADARRRVDLLQRVGEIWEDHLLNLDRAVEGYARALEVDPGYLPALKALGRICRQKGRFADLIQMHQSEIRVSDDQEQILGLLYDIAELQEDELLDDLAAAATYRSILERRPGHRPALAALSRILEAHADWPRLAQLREANLDGLTDSRSKAVQLWSAGLLREERLADPAGAIKNYTRALRLAPDLAPAQGALAHLLETKGEAQQLAELWGTALDQARQPNDRAALSTRLGDLYDRMIGDPRKAAHHYERAAEEKPSVWILWSLCQIYEAEGMHRELVGALERLAALSSDERERAEIQLRIGRILHRTGIRDPRPHLTQALSLGSGRIHALRALEQTLRSSAAQSEALADLVVARIERTKDPLELACLWTELAESHLARGDTTGAEAAFREAIARASGHLPAIWGLARLLEAQERWRERAELGETEAAAMESTRGLCDALVRAGALWEEKARDPARALPLYKRVLREHSGHLEAFRRLHRIHTAEGNWTALASMIRAQISATTDPGALCQMFIELGRLYLERLDQKKKGYACLRRVLDLEPENLYVLTTLGDLAFESGDLRAAREMYENAEPLCPDAEERRRINLRLGEIGMSLGDPSRALAAFERASSGGGFHDPALLRRMAEAAEAAGAWSQQATALERLAEAASDPGERILTRKRLAHVASELENDELAVRVLEEALVLDPLDLEAIERLAAIYGRAENRSAVNQHLQASVEHHRAALVREPFNPRLYRQLGRIFQWQRQLDRLYCACLALHALGALDDVELRFMFDHHRRCAPIPKGSLSQARYEALILPEAATGAARDLLSALGPVLQRRAAVEAEQLGVDRTSKVKPEHPLRALCDEMAALLGGVDYDLQISRSKPDLIAAEMLQRPSLIVGQRIANNLITEAERFRIGRALFLLRENALVLRDLSVRDIRHLFVALGRVATPPCAVPLPVKEESAIEAEVKQLGKLLGRKERKLLGAMLPPLCAQLAAIDVGAFARSLSWGANRAGLAVAGDAKGGLEEALAQLGGAAPSPDLADLLQFLVSEEYFTLRADLGISPGGTR